MKESAVEWYTKQILKYKSPTNINGTDYILIPVNKVDFLQEQSKEMEKEQSIAFAKKCIHKALESDILMAYNQVEQYYNETFKQEQ